MPNTRDFITSNNTYRIVFWLLVAAGFAFIMRSYPMMKTRFDIWFHLGFIDDFVHGIYVEYGRSNWYKTWAFVFKVLEIKDIRNYAVIIHRTQFVISCISIYLSSAYLLPALLLKLDQFKGNLQNSKYWISSFALTCTLVWLTVIGTVSTFQQAWIMWYSVNYQLTLPFLFLAITLFINAAVVPQTQTRVYTKIVGSLVLLILIFLFHAGELIYLFIYLIAGLVVFTNKHNIKKIAISLLSMFALAWIGSFFYVDRVPEIISLIQTGQSTKISGLIQEYGKYNIDGGNRYEANWNALYAVCVFCALPILYIVNRDKTTVNSKVFFVVMASLAYCFIPTFKLSSGVASLFYPAPIINRLYFASMLFILPSFLSYLILNKTAKFKHPIYLLLMVLVLMGITAVYSRYINNGGTYFQNINSIRNSLKSEKVGIDLPVSEIESIKKQIDAAKMKYSDSDIMYCANYDKSHIVQYVYRQKNILFDRFAPHEVADCEKNPRAKDKRIVYID
jgi:hypothetical protein